MGLNCPSSSSLFLRANGSFVCWDDSGSDTVLHEYSEDTDTAGVYRAEGPCGETARRLRAGKLPRPAVCSGCFCLATGPGPVFDPHRLDILQVEPSARCRLRCTACASDEERKRLKPPLDMSPGVCRKVLEDFSGAGITIGNFDFSGHGEPLLNPHLDELVFLARSRYPGSFIVLMTSGHGENGPGRAGACADEIHVAIDGVDQESYVRYRVGGEFGVAWEFLCGLTGGAPGGSRPRIVWKYILFDHNDRPEQLARAVRMAGDAGVDEIRFIFTSFGKWSRRVADDRDLRTVLLGSGVPASSLRTGTQPALRRRRMLSDALRRFPRLHGTGRRIWRRFRSPGAKDGYPVVTSDYCRLDTRRLRDFLGLGLRYVRSGRLDDAREMLGHVERLLAFPSRSNPDYLPDDIERELGELLPALRSALGDG